MTVIKAETAPYLEAFRARSAIPGEPKWLVTRRAAALDRFAELGFPTRREEMWRFNDLKPLTKVPFPPAAAATVEPAALAPYRLEGKAHRLVLVNGRFAPDLSEIGRLPDGVWLGSTAHALKTRPELVEAAFDESDVSGAQPFAALNGAFFADGFILALEPGVSLDLPVEVIHFGRAATPHLCHLRSAVLAEARSRVTLVESFAGTGLSWNNSVMSVRIGEGAALRHVKIQAEAAEAIHFALTRASLGRDARYETFALAVGARLSRQDTQVAMQGEGAHLQLGGAYLLRGEQEATIAPFVDHQAPGGETREVVKGVVDDRAHGVFLGTITVRPGADKTDAHQLNRNLLLSRRAAVDTKPELEIFADDVKCSHGATVGDLDEAALFYLRSRGIAEAEARRMLIEAFAADAIDRANAEGAVDLLLRRVLQSWLEKRGS
jgi:Fe-S cluster assembly protein SufD